MSATETTSRLMAKSFEVEKAEKGNPFQSKVNQWSSGKNIQRVHSVMLTTGADGTKATILYEAGDGEATKADRVLAKVIDGQALGSSALQTAVNYFSKGKGIAVEGVGSAVDDAGNATVLVLYRKTGADASDATDGE